MSNIRNWVLSCRSCLYSASSFQGLENLVEEEVEGLEELEDVVDNCETLISEYNMTDSLIYLQQLYGLATCLHTIMQDKIASWMKEGAAEYLSLSEMLFSVDTKEQTGSLL